MIRIKKKFFVQALEKPVFRAGDGLYRCGDHNGLGKKPSNPTPKTSAATSPATPKPCSMPTTSGFYEYRTDPNGTVDR